MNQKLPFTVHTPAFLQEVMNNAGTAILRTPMNIFTRLLASIATRASELNDPVLNRIMCDLTLYEIADPYSKEYNPKMVRKVKAQAKQYHAKQIKKGKNDCNKL